MLLNFSCVSGHSLCGLSLPGSFCQLLGGPGAMIKYCIKTVSGLEQILRHHSSLRKYGFCCSICLHRSHGSRVLGFSNARCLRVRPTVNSKVAETLPQPRHSNRRYERSTRSICLQSRWNLLPLFNRNWYSYPYFNRQNRLGGKHTDHLKDLLDSYPSRFT